MQGVRGVDKLQRRARRVRVQEKSLHYNKLNTPVYTISDGKKYFTNAVTYLDYLVLLLLNKTVAAAV